MNNNIDILKGLHPGFALERELKNRRLPKSAFALSIHEYPQTLSAIIRGKRDMNTSLALRIEEALGIEEGFFMTLQVFYNIKQEKKRRSEKNHPDTSKFRPALFWDTNMDTIDWGSQKTAVIQRVFERGNLTEKKEILRFYGKDAIRKVRTTQKSA